MFEGGECCFSIALNPDGGLKGFGGRTDGLGDNLKSRVNSLEKFYAEP
jgi:hypothetical protein